MTKELLDVLMIDADETWDLTVEISDGEDMQGEDVEDRE